MKIARRLALADSTVRAWARATARPNYEAAQEAQLPILVHVTGPDSIFYGPPISAGGIPDSYVERYVTLTAAVGNGNVVVTL